jgi:UDP-N-acetylmuramate dehydrogenase
VIVDFPFNYQKEVPLSHFSTLKLGGPARYLTRVRTIEELVLVMCCTFEQKIPVLVIGKGSNALFDDRGFNGMVVLNLIDFCEFDSGVLHVGAGYSFARLGVQTAKKGYKGLEFASGIPATVGGAIYMNAGAGGQETQDTLTEVEWISENGEKKRFKRDELEFGYRSSSFQKMGGVIASARFQLTLDAGARSHQKEHLAYRLKTQPYKEPSCGCVFRNPPGDSAGRLIEACGLKGERNGGVEVSSQHANFFVNLGGGSAKEYVELMARVKKRVYEQTGIELEEEVKVLPHDNL